MRVGVALLALGLLTGSVQAQPSLGDQLAGKFQQTLDGLSHAAAGVVGVSVVDLTSGRR